MTVARHNIRGSDYVGVFASATDRHVFTGKDIHGRAKQLMLESLKVDHVELSIFGTDLIGLFIRANSNGIVISNLIDEEELAALKKRKLDLNICVLESGINAIGNNIVANDKIAIIDPDYDAGAAIQIQDALGVEVVKEHIGGFKTVGANNILTNKGLVINNRATDQEKEKIDKITGFDSVRTTANTGSLNIGLSVLANSNGLYMGESTTGFELARIMEALEIKD